MIMCNENIDASVILSMVYCTFSALIIIISPVTILISKGLKPSLQDLTSCRVMVKLHTFTCNHFYSFLLVTID